MREESLGSYEMLWDCSHCDTKKNLGRTHRHCPNCGAPQDETKRYFPSDAEKVAVKDHQFTGVDRQCGSCGTPQSARASHCGQCGAPLGDAKAVGLVTEKQPPKKKRRLWILWVVAIALVLIFGLVWYACIRKREIAMQVTGHRWVTVQEIEEYREVMDEQWRDDVPSGAKALACRSKKRSSRAVPDGEDCSIVKRDRGDGTFEEVNQCKPRTRQEDVMDDWCTFRVERWTKIDELKKNGTGTTPVWADAPPADLFNTLGARRPGPKRGIFTLELNDGKNARTCDVSEATWRKYSDGQQIKAKVRASSGEIVCSDL